MLIISETSRISKLADIEDSVRGSKIIIEDNVMIDAFVKLKPAGGSGDIHIKRGTYINSGTTIYSGNGITIGEDVLIAANCTFTPVNHEYRSRDKKIKDQGFMPFSPLFGSQPGIVIGDDVWIGANSVVLDGAWIGKGAVVGAGSVVKGKLKEYGIYSGNPLKLHGFRESD